ncbi:MAG: hypothetical protein ACE145_17385 [Terriglobia bacterium]
MSSDAATRGDGVLTRVLLLYGAYNLFHNVAFLVGYRLLQPGALKGRHPVYVIASKVAESPGFWSEFAGTLAMNLLVMGSICILLNLQRVRTIPLGYLVTFFLGVTTGLFLGTNSLAALDLSGVPFLAGTATGLTIGGAETLGYVCLIAATAGISMYQRQTWWRWNEKFVRVKSLRDIRLSRGELLVLAVGFALIVVAAFRET